MTEAQFTALVPFFTAVMGAILVGVFNVVRGKMGDAASKAPTVTEIWKRMDRMEGELRASRSAVDTIRRVFLSYVDRVQTGGSSDLTEEERKALDQTEPNNQRTPE